MRKFFTLLADAIAVFVSAYMIPGVRVDGFFSAFVTAIVLAFLNFFVRPILSFFTFPLTLLTLGLFRFVINAAVLLLAARIVPGFYIDSFLTAILFSVVLSVVSSCIGLFTGKK